MLAFLLSLSLSLFSGGSDRSPGEFRAIETRTETTSSLKGPMP